MKLTVAGWTEAEQIHPLNFPQVLSVESNPEEQVSLQIWEVHKKVLKVFLEN